MEFYVDEFEIYFYYGDYPEKPFKVGHDAFASHFVECEIYSRDFGKVVAKTFSYCSVNDTYNQQTGEEIALQRALDAAGFSK